MKRILLISILAVAILPSKAQESFGGLMFSAILDTTQSSGSINVPSSAHGVAGFTYHNDTLWFDITANGLTGPITTAHIHTETSGSVEYSLFPFINGNKIKGYLTGINLKDGNLKHFLDGEYYVNIHTPSNPNGEISGRIIPEADINYKATLNMEQAGHTNPPDKNPSGLGSFNLSQDKTKLEVSVLVNDLTSNITNAHLHYGPIGVSGSVVIPISQFLQGNSYHGVYDLTSLANKEAFLDSLQQGKIYVNIHTTNFPAGEIRGQLIKNQTLSFDTWMNTTQETATLALATPAEAAGLCNFSVNSQGDSLWVDIQSDHLSGPITGAHFHTGKAGTGGGVLIGLSNFIHGNSVSGVLTSANPIFTGGLTIESFVNKVLSGDIYVNMHTTLNPAGEVRGQPASITRKGIIYSLCNQQVSSTLAGNAQGSGFVSLDRNHTNLHYGIAVTNLSSTLLADHFHDAFPGINGPVIHTLPTDSTVTGYWSDASFTSAIADKFENGEIYANFHTTNNPGGEIRGQIATGDLCMISTGINDPQHSLAYAASIYPNPLRTSATLTYTLPQKGDVSFSLFNLLGKEVQIFNHQLKTAGTYNQSVDASVLLDGVYIYRLSVNGSPVKTGKVIVNR